MNQTKNQTSKTNALPPANLEKLVPLGQPSASRRKTFPLAYAAKFFGASLGEASRLALDPKVLRQWPRLLQEGINPVIHLLLQANNTAIINRWLNNGSKVVFLSSFPRSGNTWMRFMLSDILLQMQGVETTTQLPAHPDNLVPAFSTSSITRRLPRCPSWAFEPPLAFIKTHLQFSALEHVFSNGYWPKSGGRSNVRAPLRDCRAFYLYRSPEDALVSLYHFGFRDSYSFSRNKVLHGIDDFCLMELEGWMRNVSSYLRAAENGFPVLFASYEQLAGSPAVVLDNLLDWLDVPCGRHMAQRAVANMEFAKLQGIERQADKTARPENEQRRFFRRGGPGSGRIELKESTLQEIRGRAAELLNEADRRQMKQPSEFSMPAVAFSNRPENPEPHRNGEASRNGDAREPEMLPRLQGM